MKSLHVIVAHFTALIAFFVVCRIVIVKYFQYYGYGTDIFYSHCLIAMISMLITNMLLLKSRKCKVFLIYNVCFPFTQALFYTFMIV